MLILNYIIYYYNFEIYKILGGLIFISILIFLIPFASTFLIKRIESKEKISAYECGFEPFDNSRSKFEVKFYLVGILFLLFDLEVTILIPWVIIYNPINVVIFFFFYVLTIGFVYEWSKKALEW